MFGLDLISSAFGLVTSGVKAVAGFKEQQATVIGKAIDVLGQTNASNAQREQAIAQVLVGETSSGYWLAACIRPLLLLWIAVMVTLAGFGVIKFDHQLSPMVMELFELLKIGFGGYIGGRTIEKIVSQIGVAGVLKQFIQKKLL